MDQTTIVIIAIASPVLLIAALVLYGKVLFDMFSPFFPQEDNK